ncbi:hypothetical protein NAPIS_ORF01006 [Vairimorpha apis BRL 01]|uniref:Ricin B lectin domain-containing protein n=1 Tax=Vairimorpha apis BRL 01 TaxID=1037528 RepID=T0L1K4_9MICR|nr:hypothetical protein NAPIS_ORF01006 [Vairimorpha apis BRL 01]
MDKELELRNIKNEKNTFDGLYFRASNSENNDENIFLYDTQNKGISTFKNEHFSRELVLGQYPTLVMTQKGQYAPSDWQIVYIENHHKIFRDDVCFEKGERDSYNNIPLELKKCDKNNKKQNFFIIKISDDFKEIGAINHENTPSFTNIITANPYNEI